MEIMLELLVVLFDTQENKSNPAVTSFAAYCMFALLYYKFRPHYSARDFSPIAITTTILTNDKETFPTGRYALRTDRQPIEKFDAKFKGASNIIMKFHPKSALNPPGAGGDRNGDVINIYTAPDRNPSSFMYQLTRGQMTDCIAKDKDFHFENTSSVHIDFLQRSMIATAATAAGSHSNSTNDLIKAGKNKNDNNTVNITDRFAASFAATEAPGFAFITVAEFSFFEKVWKVGPVYSSSHSIGTADAPEEYQFEYASSIEVSFSGRCNLAAGDTLTFYKRSSCGVLEADKVFRDSWTWSSTAPLVYEGSVVHFSFLAGSEKVVSGGFHFIVRPHFDASENAATNAQLLFQKLNAESEDDGVSQLFALLDSPDTATKQWAALSFYQLAATGSGIDPFSDRDRDRKPNDNSVSVSGPDTADAMSLLFQRGGLEKASELTKEEDVCLRHTGCLAMARLLSSKEACSAMLTQGLWRPLVELCSNTASSQSVIDLDTCRHILWMFSELSLETDYLDDLADGEVFDPLILCLDSTDRLIKKYASVTLFRLSENPRNRRRLVSLNIDMLVKLATSEIPADSNKSVDIVRDKIELQQGAGKVLCKLCSGSKDGLSATSALEHKLDEAIIIMLRFINKKTTKESDASSARLINKDLTHTVVAAVERAVFWSEKLETVRELILSKSATWIKVLNQLCTVASTCGLGEIREREKEKNAHTRRRISTILCSFSFLDLESDLNFTATKALIQLAGSCWPNEGESILTSLINKASTGDSSGVWVRSLLDKSEFLEKIVRPCLSIFANYAVLEHTSLVLDFLTCLSSSGAKLSKGGIQQRIHEETTKDTLPVSKRMAQVSEKRALESKFFFRVANGALELTSGQAGKKRVWRTIELFYMYELRPQYLDYMNSTLRLWSSLFSGLNAKAVSYYRSYLSFGTLYNCMLWHFTSTRDSLRDNCHLFCKLMLNLYVEHDNTKKDSEFNDPLHAAYKLERILDERGAIAVPGSSSCLTDSQKNDLVLYVNEFVGGGRRLFAPTLTGTTQSSLQSQPKSLQKVLSLARVLQLSNEHDPALTYATAVLHLLKRMISKGFYSDPTDLQFLKDSLLAAIDPSASEWSRTAAEYKTRVEGAKNSSKINSLKQLVFENLELLLAADLNAKITEYFTLQLNLSSDLEGRSCISKGPKHVAEIAYFKIMENELISGPLQLKCGMRVCSTNGMNLKDNLEGAIRGLNADSIEVQWDLQTLGKKTSANLESKFPFNDSSSGSGLYLIRYPRLRKLLNGEPQDRTSKSCLLLAEGVSSELSKSAMQYLVKSHSAMDKFSRCLDSAYILSPSEQAVFSYIQRKLDYLRAVTLDEKLLSKGKKLNVERVLNGLRFAIEGRTVGVTPAVNMTMSYGPDWTSSSAVGVDSIQVTEVISEGIAAASQYSLKASSNTSSSSTRKHSFGRNEEYELALPHRDRRVQSRYQLLALSLGLPAVLEGLLRQDDNDDNMLSDNSQDAFNCIFIGCYSLLNVLAYRNRTVKVRLGSSWQLLQRISLHLNRSLGAFEALATIVNDKMYLHVPPQLVHSLVDELADMQENKVSRGHQIIPLLTMLNKMLPLTQVMGTLTKDDEKQLLRTQYVIFNAVKNAKFIDEVFPADITTGSPDIFSNDLDGLLRLKSDVILSIVELLARCAINNRVVRDTLLSVASLQLEEKQLVSTLLKMDEVASGLSGRAMVMGPWLKLYYALHLVNSTEGIISSEVRLVVDRILYPDARLYAGAEAGQSSSETTVHCQHPYALGTSSSFDVVVPGAEYLKIRFAHSSRLHVSSLSDEDSDHIEILRSPRPDTNGRYLYVVENDLGITGSKPGSVDMIIPCNTVLTVESRVWYVDGKLDVDKKSIQGYYRGIVYSPEEYQGFFVDLTNTAVHPCDPQGRKFYQRWSPHKYTGKDLPSYRSELYIQGNEFTICFQSNKILCERGWTLVASDCSLEEYMQNGGRKQSYLYEQIMLQDPKAQVVERWFTKEMAAGEIRGVVSVPGATNGVEIVFDAASATDTASSYFNFYSADNEAKSEQWSLPRYGGKVYQSNWPGVNSRKSLYIPINKFNYRFSYGPGEGFGFRFVARAALPPPSGFDKLALEENVSVIESVHPQKGEANVSQEVSLLSDQMLYEYSESLKRFVPVELYIPKATKLRCRQILPIDHRVYCKVPEGCAVFIGFGGTLASAWDLSVSSKEIHIDEVQGIVQSTFKEKNSNQLHSVFSRRSGRSWQLMVCIENIETENFKISFGHTMQSPAAIAGGASWSGFGSVMSSWGVVCHRKGSSTSSSTAKTVFYENGMEVKRCRELQAGDVLVLRVDLDDGVISIAVRSQTQDTCSSFEHSFSGCSPLKGVVDYGGVALQGGVTVRLINSPNTSGMSTRRKSSSLGSAHRNLWFKGSGTMASEEIVEDYHLNITNGDRFSGMGMALQFHPSVSRGALGELDRLEIYSSEDSKHEHNLLATLDGFPESDHPLVVNYSSMVVKYYRSTPFAYGFRLLATPQVVQKDVFEEYFRYKGRYKVIESPHDYLPNTDERTPVHIPGARSLVVIFDPMTSTEFDYDYIRFIKDDSGNKENESSEETYWPPDGKFSGGRQGSEKLFPGIGAIDPLVIPSDRLIVSFHSDSSNQDWGYRMIIIDNAVFERNDVFADVDVDTGLPHDAEAACSRSVDNCWYFFENRSESVQTIKIDMPVVSGQAYFEFILHTDSTLTSCAQLGLIVKAEGNELKQIQHMFQSKLPCCLGLGSARGSYALDGVDEPTVPSTRYCNGPDSLRPFSKLEFRRGSIIGVLVDMESDVCKIYYFLNGNNMGATFQQESGLSWRLKGGLCPAFSVCPGQSVTVNVGRSPFYGDGLKYAEQSLLRNHSKQCTGKAFAWNIRNACWKQTVAGGKLLEDKYSDANQSYALLLGSALGEIHRRDSMYLEQAVVSSLSSDWIHETTGYLRKLVKKNVNTEDYCYWGVSASASPKDYPSLLQLPSSVSPKWDVMKSSASNVEFSNQYVTAEGMSGRPELPLTYAIITPNSKIWSAVFIIDSLSSNRENFSFGFTSNITSLMAAGNTKFGNISESWGIQYSVDSNKCHLVLEGKETESFEGLRHGDTISALYDLELGCASFSVNEGEYSTDFTLKSFAKLCVGATLGAGHKITISEETPNFLWKELAEKELIISSRAQNSQGGNIASKVVVSGVRNLMTAVSEKRLGQLGLTYPSLVSLTSLKHSTFVMTRQALDTIVTKVRKAGDQLAQLDDQLLNALGSPMDTFAISTSLDRMMSLAFSQPKTSNYAVRQWLRRPDFPLPLEVSQKLTDVAIAEIMDDGRLIACWEAILAATAGSLGLELKESNKLKTRGSKAQVDVTGDEDWGGGGGPTSPRSGGLSDDIKNIPVRSNVISEQKSFLSLNSPSNLFGPRASSKVFSEGYLPNEMLPPGVGVNKNQIPGKPLHLLVQAAMSDEIINHAPTFVGMVSRLFLSLARSVPKNKFSHLSKAKGTSMILKKLIDKNGGQTSDSDNDDYSRLEEVKTLSVIQNALVSVKIIPFCLFLFTQSKHPELQDDAVNLSNFLLLNALIDRDQNLGTGGMQLLFMQALSDPGGLGLQAGTALGNRLQRICREMTALKGVDRLKVLRSAENIMRFLQSLCDGQNKIAQDYCRQVTVLGSLSVSKVDQMKQVDPKLLDNDNDDNVNKDNREERRCGNLVTCVLDLLRMLCESSTMHLNVNGSSDESLLLVISVVTQAIHTLIDMIQGPNLENQTVLVEGNIGKVLREWILHINQLFWELLVGLESTLPSLRHLRRRSWWNPETIFRSIPTLFHATIHSPLWPIFVAVGKLEDVVMDLAFAVMDDNDNAIGELLLSLPPNSLVQRFKIHWAAIMYRPEIHIEEYLDDKREIEKIRKHFDNDEIATDFINCRRNKKQESLWNQMLSFFTNSTGSPAFSFSDLPLEDYKKELLMKMWPLLFSENQESSLSIAFSYYQVLEMLCTFKQPLLLEIKDKEKMENVKNRHAKYLLAWRSREPNSLISKSEAASFPAFFASVELIAEIGLVRTYFPIPLKCRLLMTNALVVTEMDMVMENVSRSSPEEKLDNFLDLSLQVVTVINQQYEQISAGFLRRTLNRLPSYNYLWVALTTMLTICINVMVLIYGEERFVSDGCVWTTTTYYDSGNRNQTGVGSNSYNITNCVTTSNNGTYVGEVYIPREVFDSLYAFIPVHVALSALLLLSYLVGTATVAVNKGLSWRDNISKELITLPYSGFMERFYKLADRLLPNQIWALVFLFGDSRTIYYSLFLVFSLLGYFKSIAFFAVHVLDIVARIKQMSYVVKAVTGNGGQLIVTFILAVIIIWLYVIFGAYYFGFDTYNFGESVDPPTTVWTAFWEHIDYGLHNAPSFYDLSQDYVVKHLFDMTYQIFVVVIMVAIITGVIINTFQDLSSANIAILDDIANVCFVCSLSRQVFERQRVKFQTHIETEHNPWNYLYYKVYLDEKDTSELSGRERFLKQKILKQDIGYFPIGKSLCLPSLSDNQQNRLEDIANRVDEVEEGVKELRGLIASFHGNVVNSVNEMHQSLLKRLDDLYLTGSGISKEHKENFEDGAAG